MEKATCYKIADGHVCASKEQIFGHIDHTENGERMRSIVLVDNPLETELLTIQEDGTVIPEEEFNEKFLKTIKEIKEEYENRSKETETTTSGTV